MDSDSIDENPKNQRIVHDVSSQHFPRAETNRQSRQVSSFHSANSFVRSEIQLNQVSPGPMPNISVNLLLKTTRCLMATAAVALLPPAVIAQDSRSQEDWIYTFRNQPSGEFAPDYRKADPFESLLSDADRDALAAKTAPSFITQVSSRIESSAYDDADEAADTFLDPYDVDALMDHESDEYDPELTEPSFDISQGLGYPEVDELMPRAASPSAITPQQIFAAQPTQRSNCVAGKSCQKD